jgi:hypothetical protein
MEVPELPPHVSIEGALGGASAALVTTSVDITQLLLPTVFLARTRTEWVDPGLSPLKVWEVVLAARGEAPSAAKFEQPAPLQLSISKPVSLSDVSVQDKLIEDTDTLVMLKPVGAEGATKAGVVTVISSVLKSLSPAPVDARTRNR